MVQQLGLWLRWIEQAPPEESGTLVGNSGSECGQTQGSLSLTADTVILSQALSKFCLGKEGAETGFRK